MQPLQPTSAGGTYFEKADPLACLLYPSFTCCGMIISVLVPFCHLIPHLFLYSISSIPLIFMPFAASGIYCSKTGI